MGHKGLFHLCQCKHSRCKCKGHHAFNEFLHIDRYRVMEDKDARATIKAWRECVENGGVMNIASWENRDRGFQKAELLREDPKLSISQRSEPKGPKPPSFQEAALAKRVTKSLSLLSLLPRRIRGWAMMAKGMGGP